MKKISALFGAAVMTATMGIVTVAGTQTASAITDCNGTVSGRTVNDTILVRGGDTCNIVNSTVKGSVVGEPGARVHVHNSVVEGDVDATGHYSLEVVASRVSGRIVAESGDYALIRSNIVSGSVDVWNNHHPKRIFRNWVGDRIACAGNDALITGSLNNAVDGRDGQCATMKQATSFQVPNQTRARQSDGTVNVGGRLMIYDTFGNYRHLANQKVVIELRRNGGAWQSWTETTSNASGYFSKNFPQVPGAEVRTVYPSPTTKIGWAFAYAGRISTETGPALDLSRSDMWDRIAECESNQRWDINTGNGYYGGLQFNLATWRSVDGDDFAAYPHQATREEQITVANRLYAIRGTQPWSCA
jgi:hypothetical protein